MLQGIYIASHSMLVCTLCAVVVMIVSYETTVVMIAITVYCVLSSEL